MKNKFLLMLLISSLFWGFTACGDDDDDKTDYASVIAGTYVGTVSMGDTPIATGAEIKIVRKSENVVILSMDQTIAGLPIKIDCTSDVEYKNNVYNLAAYTSINLDLYEETGYGAPGTVVPVPVKVNGTVDASGKTILNIIVGEGLPAESGFPVIATVFNGTRK